MNPRTLDRRIRSAALLAALPLLLAACCICPTTGRIMPCARTGTGAASAASTGTEAAAAPKPEVIGGTRAPAVPGAPDAWIARKNVHVTAQPDDGAWAGYSAAGYRTIVNFRPPAEGADRERELVVANGMQYFNLPVDGPAISWADADALAKILRDPANEKVLLHCSSGNRVAGVYALYLTRHEGVSRDEAISVAQSVGPMKPAVLNRLLRMLPEDGAE